MHIQPTKNGNKAKGQPYGTKTENNFKPCINRPFLIRAYMDSLDMDHLLFINQLKFSINIVKIIMKTKHRITILPKKCVYCLLKTLQKIKSLYFQIDLVDLKLCYTYAYFINKKALDT